MRALTESVLLVMIDFTKESVLNQNYVDICMWLIRFLGLCK